MKDRSLQIVFRFFALALSLLGLSGTLNLYSQTMPTGAINGLFSVSSTKQVYFSQGNLQYQASTGTWQFAANQWTYIGSSNSNISSSNSGWIDLFGWGTSGFNHGARCYQPYSTTTYSSYYYAYGEVDESLYQETGQADWGYNAISNGGNTQNIWRTLTDSEWYYLLFSRNTSSGVRFAKAKVNSINGVILLPDNWSTSYYSLSNTNNSSANYTSNTITSSNWNSKLGSKGAVFLPAAGYRSGTTVSSVGTEGYYWTSKCDYSEEYVYYESLTSSSLTECNTYDGFSRGCGMSVRLVANPFYSINSTSSPSSGGSVSGTGAFPLDSQCTLTATPSSGYFFINWTENGEVVSTSSTYSFVVTGNRSLVANFSNTPPIGAINGIFSVSATEQVFFSQGNLQYQASSNTWRFALNQWNYVGGSYNGTSNGNVSGSSNNNPSSTYSGWIDLFCWGTSGYNHGAVCYQPWSVSSTSTDYYAYGDLDYNLYDQTGKADWGYNAISNGGRITNKWRTLTSTEWYYLTMTRATSSGIRYAKACVNNVNGVILLPDDWSSSYYTLSNTNTASARFTSNVINSSQWATLEQHGAVFLPAAGARVGTVDPSNTWGGYQSSNVRSYASDSYRFRFTDTEFQPDNYSFRYR